MRRIMVFDGSIERIRYIMEHEDYTALTNKTVFSLVGPLLRCRIREMEDPTGVPLISRRTNISEQWLIDDGSRDGFVDPWD